MSSSASVSNLFKHGLPLITSATQNIYAPTGKWILGTAGAVVGMIHVGGVTRLTQSGLSMTSWSPLGSLPPITHQEWLDEFERYKQFPEWQQRKSMTLSEFQFIYGWEYGHRMLGRTVGLIFVVPWMYFTLRGKIPTGYQKRMVGLVTMGATQGVVGWWMVKSGLGDDRRGDKKEIRVKPIRLTAHLSMAVATYGALLWTGFDILSLPHNSTTISEQVTKLSKDAIRHASRLRAGSILLTGLTGITIVSGALVAGNDAGRAYNTFPKMSDEWIPSEIWEIQPWQRNIWENTATVQWNHRVLGTTTAITALSLAGIGLSATSSAGAATATKAVSALITPQTRLGLYAVGLASVGQVTLGITTLLNYVPIGLAAAHQLGSIVVFTSSLYLAHSLRYVRPAILRAAATTHQKATTVPSSSSLGSGATRAASTITNKSIKS